MKLNVILCYVRYFCEWKAFVLCFYFCCTFRHYSLAVLGHHCWGSGHYVDVVPAFVVWAYRGSSKLWQHQRFKQLRYLHVYFMWFMFLDWGSNLKHQLKHLMLYTSTVKRCWFFWLCFFFFRIGYSRAGHWAICENHCVFLCCIWVRAHHQRTNLCSSCLVS